jgi:hypothetical protein
MPSGIGGCDKLCTDCYVYLHFVFDVVLAAITIKASDVLVSNKVVTSYDTVCSDIWHYILVCAILTGIFSLVDFVSNLARKCREEDIRQTIRRLVIIYACFVAILLYMFIQGMIENQNRDACLGDYASLCSMAWFFTWGSLVLIILTIFACACFFGHLWSVGQLDDFCKDLCGEHTCCDN